MCDYETRSKTAEKRLGHKRRGKLRQISVDRATARTAGTLHHTRIVISFSELLSASYRALLYINSHYYRGLKIQLNMWASLEKLCQSAATSIF